jgi:hypothetical protein
MAEWQDSRGAIAAGQAEGGIGAEIAAFMVLMLHWRHHV